ncbi:RNA-binding protein [Haloferula helveola]|uniref:RNA-binding protein n=1 Tax=Haloferula helveola TaxID=490095 RepID=A0ABM7RBK3_9BACT|nr:RNA-binding protein [Haloferula helveola]
MIKLYIGNLSYETSEQELRELLTPYEPIVDIRRPSDRETGQPRGFAFVTFGTLEDGEKAMTELDGADFGGRALKVSVAEERQSGRHPAERPRRVSMDVEVTRSVDDRPIGPDGKRVRYKGI